MYGWQHKHQDGAWISPTHFHAETHGPIYVEMDDDVSKKDITDLQSLAKAIKDKHVWAVKGEMNIGVGQDGVKTEIEFVEANPPPNYDAFSAHMGGYGMTEQQTQKVYTLVIHGAVHWDFQNPDTLWEQLVEQGIVVPIAPAKPELTFDPNLPAETFAAKVFTFKNICNHTLNVLGVTMQPGEVLQWHSIDQHAEKWNEVQAYVKGGVLQAFNDEHAELFEEPVLRTFKNINGSAIAIGKTVVQHYEIFSIKTVPGDATSDQIDAYLSAKKLVEIDPKIVPAVHASVAGPMDKPVMVASLDDYIEHFGSINPDSSTSKAINELLDIDSKSGEVAAKSGVPVITAQQNPLGKDEDWYIDKDGNEFPMVSTVDKQLAAALGVGLVAPAGKQWATKPVHGESASTDYGTAVPKKKKRPKQSHVAVGDISVPWDGSLPSGYEVAQASDDGVVPFLEKVKTKTVFNPNTFEAEVVAAPDLKEIIQNAKADVKTIMAKAKAKLKKEDKAGKSVHLNALLGKVVMPKSNLDIDFDEDDSEYKRTFVIGDVHGCLFELQDLLERIGYVHGSDRLVFVGDLIDRGPNPLGVFRLVFGLGAEVVLGNHEEKYLRYWKHELHKAKTGQAHNMKLPADKLAFFAQLDMEDLMHMATFPTSIHVGTFEGEDFTAVHAGFEPGRHPDFQRDEKIIRVRYVDAEGMYLSGTPGAIPDGGVRWTKLWKGPHHVIYGHAVRDLVMPVVEGDSCQTIGIDTGCVMGGHLTAFELPARRFHMVRARKTYKKPMMDNADG